MSVSIVSAKGWVVIPKHIRERYGLKKGSRVRFVEYGDTLSLVPLPDDPVAGLRGMLPPEPSLTADLLRERAAESANAS